MPNPDPADFGYRLPYLIRRIDGELSRRLDLALRPHRLTQAQLSALAQLDTARPAPLSGSQLSRLAGITAQSMSAAITGLLERGLIARQPSAEHGKRLDVTITDAGTALLREVQAQTRTSEDAVDLGLDERETAELQQTLRRVARALGVFLPNDR